MADISRKSFAILISFSLTCVICVDKAVSIEERNDSCLKDKNETCLEQLTILELQKSIQVARHYPVCVLYADKDDINAEKKAKGLSNVWKKKEKEEISNLKLSLFPLNKYSNVRVEVPRSASTLRCYIGAHKYYDYEGRMSNERLLSWLQKLEDLRSDQFPEASKESITMMMKSARLSMLVFLDMHRHYEVEEMMYAVRDRWPQVPIVVVHPDDKEAKELKASHNVSVVPSVLFLQKGEGGRRGEPQYDVMKVLRAYEIQRERIDIVLHVFYSPAQHITQDNFETALMVKSKLYVPMLLLLHTVSTASLHYIIAFNRAVLELKEMSPHLRFGILEVNDVTRHVVQQHVTSVVKTTLPHTVLFQSDWIKTTVVGISQRVIEDRPTPLTVMEALSNLNFSLITKEGIEIPLWIPVLNLEVTSIYEGPHGSLCTPFSHNATDNEPYTAPRKVKIITKKKVMNLFGTWHERYAAGAIDEQLRHEGSIPVVTEDTWSGVVEKSHAPLHPFYPGEKWRGEVTKVALVVFIQADCGSCKRNMPVFEELHKTVKFVDGGSLYLVNCTSDPLLCLDHNVTGFPTLLAFRGLGWLESHECMPPASPKYVRMDYHGVIRGAAVMEWFTRAAGSAVTNSRFTHLHAHDMKEDAHLVATLVPKHSSYLPRVPNKNLDYFYSYECFRLACELLYGQVPCYVQYSAQIPQKEFGDEQQDMVVTLVSLHRRDGVWSTVMKLGRTLSQTLHEEAASNMHRFHKPHSYHLPAQLKCEEDHALCTDILVQFSLDHSRLPITRLTADLFHTKNSILFYENLPILIAFVHADNLTENAPFLKSLLEVAYAVYNSVVVVAVDVAEFTFWSNQFVPRNYGVEIYDMKEEVFPSLYVYPRLCMVEWHDHTHAAFYPPVHTFVSAYQPFTFTADGMLEFVTQYLTQPNDVIIETEHF